LDGDGAVDFSVEKVPSNLSIPVNIRLLVRREKIDTQTGFAYGFYPRNRRFSASISSSCHTNSPVTEARAPRKQG